MARFENSGDWYKFCRIALEWLHPKRDLDPEPWVEEVVARAQSLNIDTLAFDFYHGGYAIFNGAVAPKDRHVGDADVLALLDRALHKRGMRLVAMNMAAHCANYMAQEYPTWRFKDANGQNRPFIPDYLMCLNTPYSSFLIQELTEFLPRYQIDGLYIEGLFGQDCYCDYCCVEFERTYGLPIPRDEKERKKVPGYAQFRANNITNFIRRVRKVIREVSPHTILLPSPSFFENCYTDFAGWGAYSDAIELERQWGYGRTGGTIKLWEKVGLSMQVVRAESGRPPMGTLWLGWNADQDYAHSTASHYRLNFSEILLYGGTPQFHAQTIFELDQSEMHTVKEMFDLVEKVRPTMLDAHLVPYAALVLDWSDYYVPEWLKGFYQALIESHVPFEVISKRNLHREVLSKYKVVLLPNVMRLSDDQIASIEAFNAQGGGVVLTYRTSCARPDGTLRSRMPLAELAGIRGPFGIVTNPSGPGFELLPNTYYRVTDEHSIGKGTLGRLQSFRGSWAEVETTTGKAIAQATDFDFSKMHRHHPDYGWYPGHEVSPLIVVNETPGHGRVVYFAGEFDRAAYIGGLPGTLNTLAEATVWAGGTPPPVEVKAAPTVEVATHYSPSQHNYTVLLVNQTTNELPPGMVVRHVEPLPGVTIVLRDFGGRVREVRSLTGGDLKWEAVESRCVITLACLQEYETVVMSIESAAPLQSGQ